MDIQLFTSDYEFGLRNTQFGNIRAHDEKQRSEKTFIQTNPDEVGEETS